MNPLLWEELQRRGLVSQPGATTRADASSNAWASTAQRYAPAIKGIESGSGAGNYTLLGSITKTGDRAYGAYQMMGKNIPGWTREALGKSMTPLEFLRNPQAQDAVFNHRFGEYVRKYGPEGAARAWYAGERGMNNPRATDMHGRLSVADYSREFTKRANAPPPAGQQSVQLGGPQTHPTTGKPTIKNPDGSISTERTITVEMDGKHYNIPTIVDGRQVTPDQAVDAMRAGKNEPVGVFNTAQEANAAAVARSAQLGNAVQPQAPAPTLAAAVANVPTPSATTNVPRPPANVASTVREAPGKDFSRVDPQLNKAIREFSAQYSESSPYFVQLNSGYRAGDPRQHGKGNAIDIQLIDKKTGEALPNYQVKDQGTFSAYQDYAHGLKSFADANYPQVGENLRWGGYFSGPPGKYGAQDIMHFDTAGKIGMAGGSWETGLHPKQAALYGLQPGITGPTATAVAAAPGGQQAPGVATVQRPRGPPAAQTDGAATTPRPAAQTASASPAAGQSLGQRIIGGMGPRAKESLTTFIDTATGHEFITGSLDGQSYMFDVGKPSQGVAKALAGAVKPGAKPAAAAPAEPAATAAIEPPGPVADGPFPASPLPDLSGLNIDEGQRGTLSRQPATSLFSPESTAGAYGDRYAGGPTGPTGSGWATPPGEAPSWSNALSRPPTDMNGPVNTIAPGPLPQAGDAFLSPVSIANQPSDMSRSASSLPLSPFSPSRVTEGYSGGTMFAPAAAMQSTPQPQQVATIPLGDMMAPWWWQQQGFGGEGFGGAWGTPGGLDFGGGTGGFEGGGGFGLGAFTAGGW